MDIPGLEQNRYYLMLQQLVKNNCSSLNDFFVVGGNVSERVIGEHQNSQNKLAERVLAKGHILPTYPQIPLDETINICAEALCNSDLTPPSFSKDTFCQLMYSATKSVEFSFDNIMYQQIDNVAMDSSLSPALVNIFVGFYIHLFFKNFSKPLLYFRYVDDTFAVFSNETECNQFFQKVNALHPSLVFTHKNKINNSLSFLDALLKNLTKSFLPQFTENPHLQDSIHAGIYFDQRRRRRISLAPFLQIS